MHELEYMAKKLYETNISLSKNDIPHSEEDIFHCFTKNSINSFLIHSSDYAWINNIEFLSFSINQRCDTSKTDNNNDNCDIAINTDILNFINQCLLSTNRSKYHLPNGIKCKVYWHQLAKNRQFLEALVQLIATGYGDPYLQEISTILLRNICILVGTTEKHVQVEDYYPALENLLHITAGPLVIFSSSSGLGRITNWSTQALAGLLKATFTYHPDFCINYDPNAWTEKILLFCHVIHVFHRLLPKLFLTESSSFGSHEHLARLHRHIEDDTFDLEMLSAFLNLFIVTVKLPSVKLLLSSNDETRKVERKKFLSVIQYALSNLCLATGRAWLCTACADSLVTLDVFGFLDYQEVGNLFIGRKCTDHDFSMIYFTLFVTY
ncbi:unnamed protein product [Heterobilharzia americana]|nr:unnamed protein product [Heterobilharzia americana]